MNINLAAEIQNNKAIRRAMLRMKVNSIAETFGVERDEAKTLQIHAAFCKQEAMFG